MKFLINISTGSKLLLSFGLIWIMFLIVIIYAFLGLKKITNSEKQLHDIHHKIVSETLLLRSHQNHNRADILAFFVSNDEKEKLQLENSLNDRASEMNTIIDEISQLDDDPYFQSQINELQSNIEDYRINRIEEIKLINQGNIEEAKTLASGIQTNIYNTIIDVLIVMADHANKDAKSQLETNQKDAYNAIMMFIILGTITLFFSIIIVVVINKIIALPLNDLASLANRIADGDLKVEINATERNDEVGKLSNAFYLMVFKLKASLEEIIGGVTLLGSSASEILSATTQVAASASESASAISETSTTVEEVRQAAQLSSKKASNVSENAQEVAQVTLDGEKAVDDTVKGMHDIQKQMDSVANTIVRLSEQSQQIGGIIAAVTDVAEQSNLLAVNASIEAAKAGEHGKGFAVVAQEIKSLAQQSKQSTIQVRNILNDVQKATSAAVMATEQTSKAVESGVKQSNLAGEAIKKLAESTEKAVEAALQIVASSNQQVAGMDQIGLAMQNIEQAGAENAASMIQAEKSAKDLNELGQKLDELVKQYKL